MTSWFGKIWCFVFHASKKMSFMGKVRCAACDEIALRRIARWNDKTARQKLNIARFYLNAFYLEMEASRKGRA